MLLAVSVFGQKGMQRIMDASKISAIDIAGNTMFKIIISTKPVQTIALDLQVQGENNEQIVLQTRQENDTLFIGSAYQPLFLKPDDKLAAHKKISIELTLQIPENLTVNITSDIASVTATGQYKYMTAELLNGHFLAQQFKGSLQVDTLHGNIMLQTNAGNLEMHTKKGFIESDDIPFGIHEIMLNSVNGNITVTKTH